MEENTPLQFDEYIFENVPELLQKVCNIFEEQHEKEMMLLSSLCVLSGCLPNVFGVYDNSLVYPYFYVFIVAPPSSGKGKIIYAKKLGDEIHQKIKGSVSEKSQTLYLPPNSSSAFFVEQLSKNDEKGILFASEADTLSNSLKQEWGDFSDILRCAFHHEPYSSGRKENNKANELDAPRLATLLTGTPNQIQTLISSVENGLFSRFCFYRLNTIYEFKNVFKRQTISYDDHFKGLSKDVLKYYNLLSDRNKIEFKFSPKQEDEFVKFYKRRSSIYKKYGNSFIASYNRIALIHFRIAMVLSTLRALKLGSDLKDVIHCEEIDYKISKLLIESILDHTVDVFSEMPTNDKKHKGLSGKQLKLYMELPDRFKRKDVIQLTKDLKISESTLNRLIANKDYFESLDNEGNYQKKMLE